MHQQMEPARTPSQGDHSSVERREAGIRSKTLAQQYENLEHALEKSEPYKDILFMDDFLPENKQQRFRFLHELQLPFATETYSFQQGGRAEALWWIWRAPSDPADSQPQQTARITFQLNADILVF